MKTNKTEINSVQHLSFFGLDVRVHTLPFTRRIMLSDAMRALRLNLSEEDLLKGMPESERSVEWISGPAGPEEVNMITIRGLYRLIMRSESPDRQDFFDWVLKEIDPPAQERLWKLLDNPKLPARAAAAVIRELGIGAWTPRRPVASSPSRPALIDITAFWTEVLKAVTEGRIALHSFLAFPARGATTVSCELFLDPQPILKAVERISGAWQGLGRKELRQSLGRQPGWIAGKITKAMGPSGSKTATRCWGLIVDQQSPEPMIQLCGLLTGVEISPATPKAPPA